MNDENRRWRRLLKWALAAVILAFVGWRLSADIAELSIDALTCRTGWLIVSAASYLAGLGCSGAFWIVLLRRFGQKPAPLSAMSAFYVSQLGKYVPGKALALAIRGGLLRSHNVHAGVAIVAAFYEVLTFMAAGALLAAVLFVVYPPNVDGLPWNPVVAGVLLAGCVCVPLLPWVFNRLVKKLAAKFQRTQTFLLPELKMGTLMLGLAVASVGWIFIGLSLWALCRAIIVDPPSFSGETFARCTAIVSLSYVAGFLAIVVPSGLGVREYLLVKLLAPLLAHSVMQEADPTAAATAIVLRITWTIAELIVAGVAMAALSIIGTPLRETALASNVNEVRQ